jgi:hypothetical protein
MVISFHTARRYRGGHPRIYVAGVPASNLATPQTWGSGGLSVQLSAWEYFIAQFALAVPAAAGPATHVNVSYYQGFTNTTFPSGRIRPVPKLRSGGPIQDFITGYSVNPKVASQRRRNLQNA